VRQRELVRASLTLCPGKAPQVGRESDSR
jgi:hypothetical protein